MQEALIVYTAVRQHSSGNKFIDFTSAKMTEEECLKFLEELNEEDPQINAEYPVQYVQKLAVIPIMAAEENIDEVHG